MSRQSDGTVLIDVMGRFSKFLVLCICCYFCACATPTKTGYTLEQAIDKNVAMSVPMRVTENGLIVLEGIVIDGHSLDMILDTGATQSAIFRTSLQHLNTDGLSYSEKMVHGMMQSKQHDTINFKKLEIGTIQFLNKSMVILEDRNLSKLQSVDYDGLIGMDVLDDYRLYISPEQEELRLISNDVEVLLPYYWDHVDLIENPFIADNRSLHFIELRVDGRLTPALVDTGSEFNAMNWNSASHSEMKPLRKKLLRDWQLKGASGTFKPVAKINLQSVRSGQKFWEDKDFVIMDFESLGVLGFESEPFIIVGMKLFEEETFVFDFQKNLLRIKPKRRDMFQTFESDVYRSYP